jgi:hypothetical protein
MPSVKTQVTTRRYRSSLWLKGNAFVASLIPLLIYLVFNGVFFWLFWGPFATEFPTLFPISQVNHLLLIPVFLVPPHSDHHKCWSIDTEKGLR